MSIIFERGQTWDVKHRGILLYVRRTSEEGVTFLYLGAAGDLLEEQGEPPHETVPLASAQATAEKNKWKLVGTTRIIWESNPN